MAAKYLIRDIRDGIVAEGVMAGKKVIEIVFGACNYWDGEPSNRSKGRAACSMWCDVDFCSCCSKTMTAAEIANRCREIWDARQQVNKYPGFHDFVLLTGGEPLMFADVELAEAIRDHGFQLMLATNGSMKPADGLLDLILFVSVSPKLEVCLDGSLKIPDLKVCRADELAITLPGAVDGKGWTDEQLHQIETEGVWRVMYVSPIDPTDPRTTDVTHMRGGFERYEEISKAIERCLEWIHKNPKWRICIQLNKVLNL